MSEELIRIVLADDHALVRTGIRAVLETATDMQVVGEASDGAEAVALAEKLEPDVVIMDVTMSGIDGPTATRELSKKGYRPRVLALTMHAEEDYLVPMIEAGAAGYLLKTAVDRELITAVRTIARGGSYIRAAASRILARGLRKHDELAEDRERFGRLSDRERDVVRLVAHGLTGPEIGERMHISPKTVDTYRQRIHEKIGLAHRSEYIRLAIRLQLLTEQSLAEAR